MRKARASLIASVVIGLLAVTTAGVSTYAWFQANSSATISPTSNTTNITVNKPDDFTFYAYRGNTVSSHVVRNTDVNGDGKKDFEDDFITVTSSNLAAQTSFSNFYPGQSYIYATKIEGATSLSIDITKIISNDISKQGGAIAGSPLPNGDSGTAGVKYYTRTSSAAGAGYLNDGSYAYTYSGIGGAVVADAANKYYPLIETGSARTEYDETVAINVGWAVDIFEFEEIETHGDLPTDYSTLVSTKVAAGSYNDRFNFSATTNPSVLSAAGTGSAPNKVITLGSSVGIYNNATASLNYAGTTSALSASNDIYVFFTVVYSDSNSTYYKEVKSGSDPTAVIVAQDGATRYFKKDTGGNSNCYAGLKFSLNEIKVNIG